MLGCDPRASSVSRLSPAAAAAQHAAQSAQDSPCRALGCCQPQPLPRKMHSTHNCMRWAGGSAPHWRCQGMASQRASRPPNNRGRLEGAWPCKAGQQHLGQARSMLEQNQCPENTENCQRCGQQKRATMCRPSSRVTCPASMPRHPPGSEAPNGSCSARWGSWMLHLLFHNTCREEHRSERSQSAEIPVR